MAAGAQATTHGWRSSYRTMGIFNAGLLVLFLLIYEETKYVPLFTGKSNPTFEEGNSDQDKKNALDRIESASVNKGSSVTEKDPFPSFSGPHHSNKVLARAARPDNANL